MKKFFAMINRLEETLLIILLLIMLIIIFLATVGRFTNLFVITWAEELARYCMIWIVFIGISVGARKGEHFSVQALELFLSKRILKIIYSIKILIVISFNFFAAYWGFVILSKQMSGGQVTPSLRWPMWSMYLVVPIGLILMAVWFSVFTYGEIKHKNDDEKGPNIL